MHWKRSKAKRLLYYTKADSDTLKAHDEHWVFPFSVSWVNLNHSKSISLLIIWVCLNGTNSENVCEVNSISVFHWHRTSQKGRLGRFGKPFEPSASKETKVWSSKKFLFSLENVKLRHCNPKSCWFKDFCVWQRNVTLSLRSLLLSEFCIFLNCKLNTPYATSKISWSVKCHKIPLHVWI